jgi:hypothetical protein
VIQARVRSTTHLRGKTLKVCRSSGRLTICRFSLRALPAQKAPDEVPEATQARRYEGQVISRSSDSDLQFSREKLREARRLLHEEIELRTKPDPSRRCVLRERTGSAEEPGMIDAWHGDPRLFEEVYWWTGDMDASDPWDKCTRTPGYWWRCSVPGSANPGIAILMTVSADRVVEASTRPPSKGPDAIVLPATLENFRTSFSRIDLVREAHRRRPQRALAPVLVSRQPLRAVPPRHGRPPRPHRRMRRLP